MLQDTLKLVVLFHSQFITLHWTMFSPLRFNTKFIFYIFPPQLFFFYWLTISWLILAYLYRINIYSRVCTHEGLSPPSGFLHGNHCSGHLCNLLSKLQEFQWRRSALLCMASSKYPQTSVPRICTVLFAHPSLFALTYTPCYKILSLCKIK